MGYPSHLPRIRIPGHRGALLLPAADRPLVSMRPSPMRLDRSPIPNRLGRLNLQRQTHRVLAITIKLNSGFLFEPMARSNHLTTYETPNESSNISQTIRHILPSYPYISSEAPRTRRKPNSLRSAPTRTPSPHRPRHRQRRDLGCARRGCRPIRQCDNVMFAHGRLDLGKTAFVRSFASKYAVMFI